MVVYLFHAFDDFLDLWVLGYHHVIVIFTRLLFAGVSATLVLYQIVNFHHYIVDALIWKTRRPAAARVALHAS